MARRHDRALGRPVQRYDRIAWRADQARRREGPGGSWDVPGVACRSGVQVYEDERGTVRELRPHHEVMDPASLATLVGVTLTLQHPGQGQDPDGGEGEVTPQNYRSLTHGTVLSVTPDAPERGLVEAWSRLQSEEIQGAAQAGTRELSCGYEAVLLDPWDPANATYVAELGPEPGLTHEGERYDLIQTTIRYNHLAVVDQARAGSVARLRLDGKAKTMKRKITLDGKTHEIAAWIIDAAKTHDIPADKRADAGEVLEVMIEGMEKALVLPKEMVDQMLAAVGMGGSGPSQPEPEPAADMGEPEMLQADRADMENGEEDKDKTIKMDAKAIAAMVDRQVRRAIDAALPKASRAIADSVTTETRARAALDRQALPVLGQRFDFAAHDAHGIAVEVLRADASPKLEQAQALAKAARRGDDRAAGRLEQLMDDVLDRRRDAADSSGDLGAAMFEVGAQAHTDSAEDEVPSWTKRSDARRKMASGKVETETSA